MGLEIDMVQAGDADAFALRVDNFVAIIDGGYEEHGIKLVEIVKKYYGQEYVDLVVCTHPDEDHIKGLEVVINNLGIGHVWIHDPMQHGILAQLNMATVLQRGQAVKSLAQAREFIAQLDRNGISRSEPFSRDSHGPLQVLGPSQEFYEAMLSGFGDINSQQSEAFLKLHDTITEGVLEELGVETMLDEKSKTSAENNSSVIMAIVYEGKKHLFTGDAGVQAIQDAQVRWDFGGVHWLNVPHHGSRRNLSSAIVDYLRPAVSFISAEGSKKHPHRAVVNALKKHGRVYSTHNNSGLRHHENAPARSGYVAATAL